MKLNGRLLQLSLTLILGAVVSCTSGQVGPSEVELSDGPVPSSIIGTPDTPDINLSLLSCTPQKYLVNSQPIGPKGGKIKVGSHVLEIPAGALAGYVTIVAEQITGSTNSVRFSPEGLTFDRPALLTLSYDNCLAPPVARKIVYTSDRLEILELLKSVDKVQTKTVISPIDHFSRYAVAY